MTPITIDDEKAAAKLVKEAADRVQNVGGKRLSDENRKYIIEKLSEAIERLSGGAPGNVQP